MSERWCDIANDLFFFFDILLKQLNIVKSISEKKYIAEIICSCKDFPLFNNSILSVFSDLLRTIKDPEKPQTLEQLDVVYEDCITICHNTPGGIAVIRVEFNPTVPHCSLATLIGLCIRVKLERYLIAAFKLDIYIKEGAHSTEQESIYIYLYLYIVPTETCICLALILY